MAERFPFPQTSYQQPVAMPVHNQQTNVLHYPGVPLWQQQSQQQQIVQEQKQREYQKQQQKLRLINSSANKVMSADKLIENLLDKKETFQLKPTSCPSSSHNNQGSMQSSGFTSTSLPANYMVGAQTPSIVPFMPNSMPPVQKLPAWLTPHARTLPPIYCQVWSLVAGQNGLADTTRLFPILISSGLTADVLGHIWGLANKEVPGQLTETELYAVLALIALAQNGCPFSSLNVLNLIPQAPVPNINVGVTPVSSVPGDGPFPSSQNKMKREELNLKLDPGSSHAASNLSVSEKKTESEEMCDDFTDFQSFAVATHMTEIPGVPNTNTSDKSRYNSSVSGSPLQKNSNLQVDNTMQKCPNVVIIGNTSHSRGIGSRLANHSLGAPKQSKARHKHHHHHHHHHRSSQQLNNSHSAVTEDDFTDFQQADNSQLESFSGSSLSEKTSNSSMDGAYVLKESAIRSGKKTDRVYNILESKSNVSEYSPPQLKERTPPVIAAEISGESYSTIDIGITENNLSKPGSCVNTQVSEHSSEVAVHKPNSGNELMTVEEDRYSALRALSVVNNDVVATDKESSLDLGDDFGDFVTAELATDDSFAVISSRDSSCVNKVQIVTPISSEITPVTEFAVDWADFPKPIDVCSKSSDSGNSASSTVQNVNVGNSMTSANVSQIQSVELSIEGPSSSLQYVNSPLADMLPAFSNLTLNSSDGNGGIVNTIEEKDLKIDNSTFGTCFQSKSSSDVNNKGSLSQSDFPFALSEPTGTAYLHSEGNDDDFGDFVSTESPTGEATSNANKEFPSDVQTITVAKDSLYDTHSVSSLEFPAFSLSRHGSLPSLELKVFSQGSGFQSQSVSPQATEQQVVEWCRCVQSCLSLLQSALHLFSSITSGEVLEEVLNINEGKDYLNNLLEVHGVCLRVKQTFKLTSAESKQLESLLCDVDHVWDQLQIYYDKADVSVHLEIAASQASDVSVCGICLTAIEGSSLEYEGQMYHAACANLWINCVDCSLPVLATSLL